MWKISINQELEKITESERLSKECHIKCFMRKRGKPRKSIEQDLRKMEIIRWREKFNDRNEWRRIVLEGKGHPKWETS